MIVLASLALLRIGASQTGFVIAGITVEAAGLAFLFKAHLGYPGAKRE